MNEATFILLSIGLITGALLIQYIYNRCTYGEPEHLAPGAEGREFGRAFLSSAPEVIEVSPDGNVLIQSRMGQKFTFHRNEVRAVRGRDLIDGRTEVVIDLFERRIVVDVSSKAVQQDMVFRLER